MRAQKLSIQGVGIQIEDHGGPGKAVLFIHHGGSNLRVWDPVVPFFVNDYRCITLDLRAHGLSDAPTSGYHIDDMARDVSGVLVLTSDNHRLYLLWRNGGANSQRNTKIIRESPDHTGSGKGALEKIRNSERTNGTAHMVIRLCLSRRRTRNYASRY